MSTKIDAPADDITLPELPHLDVSLTIPYCSIRYIPGYAEQTVYQLMQAYARAAILADRASPSPSRAGGWISVEDRLPEAKTEVLVAFAEQAIPSTGQYTGSPHDQGGWCYPSENRWTGLDGADPTITHWMPLPAAPGQAALPAAVDVGAAQAETAQAAPKRCSYCDDTGDVHGLDGEWRGECTECPAAITRTFKNFHANLCKRFGYAHDEKDWQRDLVSLEEHVAKLAAQAAPVGCQCPACTPVLHASDCAVHNAPAMPVGPCNCGAAPGMVLRPAKATKEMMVAAVKFANGDAVYKVVAAGALEIEEQIYGEIWETMVAAATPGATHGNN